MHRIFRLKQNIILILIAQFYQLLRKNTLKANNVCINGINKEF